jgi:neutral amino acid transport system ATP-binding protein
MTAPLLELSGVVKRFGGVPAVDGAGLSVTEGTITALIGPNGAGKTSLFNVVSGFERPDAGVIRYAGARIDGLPPHRLARRGLVRTFQQPRILRRLTVLENMLLGGQRQPGESLWRALGPGAGRRDRELTDRALELLRTVGLDGHAGAYAGVLSTGQRKLLELARALMAEPRLLLLDEPLAGVNPALRELLLERIQELRPQVTCLVIEHDLESVMRIAERVAVMDRGRVIYAGDPEAARREPAVLDAYLGTVEVGW